jgi:predicted Fe-Mo cluster-binding NifX family protein
MRIAIPMDGEELAHHFGHCEKFALIDVDGAGKQILSFSEVDAPEHQPGFLPGWLKAKGVGLVIAGGIGAHALSLFEENGIEVIPGAPAGSPAALVKAFLDGRLEAGENRCDH